ncbi:tryptophan dimethylallyltransferase-domain-containing protein [Aspergillus crustosus]
MLAVTNTTPAQSRLKSYLHTPHTSFSSVRHILSLDGKIPLAESHLQDLRSFIAAITLRPPDLDHPEEAELPSRGTEHPGTQHGAENQLFSSGYIYSFEIPGSEAIPLPRTKLYIPLSGLKDDSIIAQALSSWLAARNRGQYTSQYRSMLTSIAPHHGLEKGCKGVQTYVGCGFTETGELYITSYMGPRYDETSPLRMGSMVGRGYRRTRGTRRRSDSR